MKKYVVFISIVIVVVGLLFAQEMYKQPFSTQWEKVEELAAQQLPESALKEVEQILQQAQKENNAAEVIKALVYKMRFTLDKEPDKATELISEFEAYSVKATEASEKALLQSMTAELYAQHYQNNRWNITRRTLVTGFVPEDINEWTKNIYFEKITALLDASLQNEAEIQQTDALKFVALLEVGDDSRTLQPTLFDFLTYRAIDIIQLVADAAMIENPLDSEDFFIPAKAFVQIKLAPEYHLSAESKIITLYQHLLAFHLTNDKPEALVYADLQRLEFFKNKFSDTASYLKALVLLEKNFNSQPSVVEVLAAKADYYRSKSYEDINALKTAYDICQDGISRFPDYKRITLLQNIQAEILRKQLNVNYKPVVLPTSEQQLKINYANIESLELRVYKLDVSAEDYFIFKQNSRRERTLHPSAKLIETQKIALKKDKSFGMRDTLINLNTGGYGIYEFSLSEPNHNNGEQMAYGGFTVTSMSYMMRKSEENKINLYVLDRKSGKTLANAKVTMAQLKWKGSGYGLQKNSESKTDKNGLCSLNSPKNNYSSHLYFIENGDDKFFCSVNYQYFNSYKELNETQAQLSILTDRALYRPGQTVYFKGISYFATKNRQEVNKKANYEITLSDVNSQKVSAKKFKTNEFGSFAGEFVLPQDGLNGAYTLSTGNYSQTIWVEEYKRPTFEVEMTQPDSEIRFGEKVILKGTVKAFAGYDIANAQVKYRIVQKPHFYCWWINAEEKELSSGVLSSDANGNFQLDFVPEKPKNVQNTWRGNIYTYSLQADVSAPNGETQQGEMSFSVGDKSLFILATIPEKLDKSTPANFPVHVETLNGERITSQVSYEVFRLENPEDFTENEVAFDSLKVNTKVLDGKYNSADKTLSFDLKKWNSGLYRIVFKTTDKFGSEIKANYHFVLFGQKDSRPPVKTYVWLNNEKTEFEPGEKAIIHFGTSTQNTMVLFELMIGNKILESKWVKFNNQIKTFKIPFKSSYDEGVNVQFSFMKDEKLFTRQLTLSKKKTEKKLTPKFSTFRNKLLPGAHETWTVTIPNTENKQAELLAAMYDASLDAIRSHNWFFNPSYNSSIPVSPLWRTTYESNQTANADFYVPQLAVYQYQLDRLNWFGLSLGQPYYHKQIRLRGSNNLSMSQKNLPMEMVAAEAVLAKGMESVEDASQNIVSQDNETNDGKKEENFEKPKGKPVQLRTNFSETAFFYPQLKTDAQGNVQFSFTAPESLTRWNVKLLAHSADLYFGQFDTTAVTQKDLMVQMNLPRFVRRSDKLVLSAQIINMMEKAQNAEVTFELIDPATEKAVFKQSKPVSVLPKGGGDAVVSFELNQFSNYELLICKIVIDAGEFSDGEQKYLPILPDKVLVTESVPLIIRAGQTRTFHFKSLLENASKVDTKNLTVEFSSNPAWYAVQALPTLSQPDADNALSLFTAYYANTLAGFIANSNPKIARIFNQWKNAKGSREALLSNLEKNQELKNMLLEETPWIMAAKDETEQKRQIALLFDLNMQKNMSVQYFDKLLKLQKSDGGFGWYEGMASSRYITQEILLNMARLRKMTGQKEWSETEKNTIVKALNFLDLEISRDLAELKKHNKNYQTQNCIGNMQLFYLHLRSEYPEIPVMKVAEEASHFYTAQSEKYWTSFTLYGKAMTAIVAHRNEKLQVESQILKSLRENALKTDEFGMYWAKNTAGYFWNDRPVAVQAAIIEAFAEITSNKAEIDEMKIWLLKQKQTQRWDSPVAAVNAVYALLVRGSDWLQTNTQVSVSIGSKVLKPESTEAGTGYFKQTIPSQGVMPEMSEITVSSIGVPQQSTIGWGAVYWQYYQDIDKVQGQSGNLKISKKLFVKQGKSMIPVEQNVLKKGDKVVTRLVVTTDRALEFVALKDLRASCFEPVDQLSGFQWKENVSYYQTTKDASTQFFFNYLPKGTYVFEYELWVNNQGVFANGMATIQCLYAPEFVSHTGGDKLTIQ